MASERELIESTPGDERDIRRGADGSLTAQIDRQRRVTRVLAGFALLITLAGLRRSSLRRCRDQNPSQDSSRYKSKLSD